MFEIRDATSSDVIILREIYLEAIQFIKSKGIDQWSTNNFQVEDISSNIEKRNMYLVYYNGNPIGMFSFYSSPQWIDRLIWGEISDNSTYLHKLAIIRAYAGKGFGSKIIQWSELKTMELGKNYLRLDCMAENPDLNKYYQTHGFLFKGLYDGGVWKANKYEKIMDP
jgi:GNAT superfamily N-acetyltransferase